MSRERVAIAPDAPTPEELGEILERARHRGFTRFVVSENTPIEVGPEEELLLRNEDHLARPGPTPARIPLVVVGTPESLDDAVRRAPDGGILAVEWTGDRVIPLENAIARVGDRYELWVFAKGPREVPGALGALEHGAHRVIVTVRSPDEVDVLESLLEGPLPSGLDWALVPVVSSRAAGLGDRVIVDTTSILDPEEGLLVGSAAGFLFHVASEAVGSKFSRPRAFRVNAGAAHSYVLMADGTTRYLSELEPGDAVLATRPRGTTRLVRVGRVKIERRPMVVVTAEDGEFRRTVFLQEAETVRLSAEDARVPTTELAAGVRVHGVRMPPARHLGREVAETIVER